MAKEDAKAQKYLIWTGLLLGSILSDDVRDGKTPDTALQVINIGEQYLVMQYLRLKPSGKALIPSASGKPADCHNLAEPSPQFGSRICFDVSIPMAKLSQTLPAPPPAKQ
jgi:hypothetical protein